MDTARIHMNSGLEDSIASRGPLLFLLTPRLPHLNPLKATTSAVKDNDDDEAPVDKEFKAMVALAVAGLT